MKALKWIFSLLAVVVVVAVIAVVIGLKNLDSIVIAAVERVGSEVTGTRVGLDGAQINLQDGRAELTGLSIANPRGFSNALLLDVDKIAVDIAPASLTRDVIVIDEVLLSGINILAEQKNLTDTNIQALLDNVKRNTAGGKSQAGDGDKQSGKPVLLAVEKFVFDKSSLRLVTEELGDASIPLPPIELRNLGSAEQGLTPEQLAQRVTEPVLQQVKKHVAKQLEDIARQKAEEKAQEALQKKIDEKLSGSEKETLNTLKGLFK